MAASRTATALRQRRLAIRLCRPAADLLTHFLQASPRQLLMLGIVNEHIQLEVSKRAEGSGLHACADVAVGPWQSARRMLVELIAHDVV